MKTTISILLTLAVACHLTASKASAMRVQPVFSYQGFLLNDDGTPANGTFDMQVAIYDVPEGGTPLWQEAHAGVSVENGLFIIIVGGSDPPEPDIFVNETEEGEYALRYLEIQVGADPPMAPRTQLLATPYSVASHRLAGDIFTSPGSIRMGIEPTPFLPLMEMNVGQNSAEFRMGVEPVPFVPTVEIQTNPNSTTYKMGVEPQPFEPAVEINASQNNTTFKMGIEPEPFDPAPEIEMLMDENSTTFRMGVDPEPFNPTVEINSALNETAFRMGISPQPFDPLPELQMLIGQNSTSFRMGVEPEPFNPWPQLEMVIEENNVAIKMGIDPEPFDPSPELEMLVGQNSTTFRMGIDPQPFKPSVQIQALTDLSSFTMFDPTASSSENAVSQMNAMMGGQFGWNLWVPSDAGSQRPVMDMNTGPGGELNWLMFNPQPEPPGIAILGMNTNANGADFSMTSPQYGGLRTDVSPPMIQLATLGELSTFTMFDPTAGPAGSPISQMNANVGGQFSWHLFGPQEGTTGRPVMEMNTGPAGEMNWLMFNPQPEPPGDVWMDFGTDASGPHFEMTVPQAGGGGGLQITDPMLQIKANSAGPEIILNRIFTYVGGAEDSTRIHLHVDSTKSEFDMFGPGSGNNPTIQIISGANGALFGVGTSPTTILTVQERSATDPVADAWTMYSSRRWKKNIKTISNPLEKVMSLRGVTYDWKADGKHDIGLIAEEVGEVFPEIVAYEENGIDAKSVDYARLVAVLIEAVKEQQSTISELEKEVDDLSRRYRDLTDTPTSISIKNNPVELSNVNR